MGRSVLKESGRPCHLVDHTTAHLTVTRGRSRTKESASPAVPSPVSTVLVCPARFLLSPDFAHYYSRLSDFTVFGSTFIVEKASSVIT